MGRGIFRGPALNGRPHGRLCIRRNPVVWPHQRNPCTHPGDKHRRCNLVCHLQPPSPLLFTRKPPARQTGDKLSLAASYRRILQTFRELQRYREIFKLLLARLVYNDGLITVFAFGGIYAAGTFGFTFEEVLFFGIIVNIAAGIGAWCFGYLDDRLGGKLTIQITLVGFVIAAIIAVVPQEKIWFWIAGILVGLFAGPNQSASRSLMGRFVPQNKETEFYGFYAFSGKATAFLGPLLMGVITQAFGSQRYGMATVGLFFIIGGLLLRTVDEQKGIRMARQETPPETDA